MFSLDIICLPADERLRLLCARLVVGGVLELVWATIWSLDKGDLNSGGEIYYLEDSKS